MTSPGGKLECHPTTNGNKVDELSYLSINIENCKLAKAN